jgi:hypothetical protein
LGGGFGPGQRACSRTVLILINSSIAAAWLNSSKSDELAMFRQIQNIVTRARDFIASVTRPPEFVCGDCELNQQCGLPPHEDCIEKAMQRERDPDGRILLAKRRAQARLHSVAPL